MHYPRCCPFIKRDNGAFSAQWCACSVGYAKNLFSQLCSRSVRGELLESIAAGDKSCAIKMSFEQLY